MKKISLIIAIFLIFSNVSFAENFDDIQGLTPVQKAQISKIMNEFNFKNGELENRITNYTNKLNEVLSDNEKTAEQKALLTGAYERNIATLKAQQQVLEKETDSLYKSVLTPEQYNQVLQFDIQDVLKDFLKNKEN